MTRAITIELSDEQYRTLNRVAELSQQPVDTIISQSLEQTLTYLLQEVPTAYQADILPLLSMTPNELEQEVHTIFPKEQWQKYETLLDKKKETTLTKAELDELDQLRRQGDIVTYRKGYAAVLLKRRGYPVPALSKLPSAK